MKAVYFLFHSYVDDLAHLLGRVPLDTDVSVLLFADDIQALALDDAGIIKQASITNSWARRNGMQINAKKSGLLGTTAHVEMGGEQVPILDEYTYLGVPHRLTGINYEALVARYSQRANAMAQAVSTYCNAWPEMTKLVIYKAFIRSRMEYCGPLLFASPLSPARTRNIQRLDEVQDRCLRWIVPYSSSLSLTRLLVGLPKMEDRLHGLAVSFCDHVNSIEADHPTWDVLRYWCRFPICPPSVLSPRIKNLPLRHSLQFQAELNDQSLRVATKHWYIDRLEGASTWGGTVLNRKCRIEGYGPDSCIRLENDNDRQNAIRWRTNSFLQGRTCPRCNRGMTRGCIVSCFDRLFPSLSEQVRTFSVLDDLLNRKCYLVFLGSLKMLEQMLERAEVD